MLGNADGHATNGEPICRPPSQSPVEKPSAIAPSAGGHLAQRSLLARWKGKNTAPLIKQKPGPKKRSEPGQEQAIFSFDPF